MAPHERGVSVKIYSSGYEHLEDFVIPFVTSVMAHEPWANLTIVDNGSPTPYPEVVETFPVARTDNLAILTSFNKAISGDWDWLVITDTDVLCRAPFLAEIAKLDPHNLYGRQMFHDGDLSWFDSWMLIIPRQAWDELGKFDEDFKLTGAFQDMDYCIRAQRAGYGLETVNLPFEHIGANTTHKSPDFWANREYNKQLVQDKHGIKLSYK